MRINLVGSVPNNDYDRTPEAIEKGLKDFSDFFAAASQIGRVIAERGHTLIIGSEFPLTVDHHAVLYGMVPVITARPNRDFFLEVWRPIKEKEENEEPPYNKLLSIYDNLKIEQRRKLPGFPYESRLKPRAKVVNTNLWTFAHMSAIVNSDVLLAMGGTVGTERAVYIAEESGVPFLPIRSFGGGAERAYNAYAPILLKLPGGGYPLSAKWNGQSANDLISLAEKIGRHSYFISYSHTHIEWCDFVHLALYTRGRVVLRDTNELKVGEDVQPKLMNAIEKAETFILLWSKEAAKSKWCALELKHARNLHDAGLPPRRIVVLRKDNTPLPKELQNLLWLDAADRRQTDDAVNRIVAEESLH